MIEYENKTENDIADNSVIIQDGKIFVSAGEIKAGAKGKVIENGRVELKAQKGVSFNKNDALFYDMKKVVVVKRNTKTYIGKCMFAKNAGEEKVILDLNKER